MTDFLPVVYLFVFLTVLTAACIQGITGFGFALLAMPVLTLFFGDARSAVPMVVFYSLLMNILIFWDTRKHIQWKRVGGLLIGGAAGIPLGAYLLLLLNADYLKLGAGIIILLYALVQLKGVTIPIRREGFALLLTGFLSGVLNSSISLSGPPVVLFLSNQKVRKDEFRATLAAAFMLLNTYTLIVFYFSGLLRTERSLDFLVGIPALLLGMAAGIRLARHIKEGLFRKLTLGLIICVGMVTLLTAMNNMLF